MKSRKLTWVTKRCKGCFTAHLLQVLGCLLLATGCIFFNAHTVLTSLSVVPTRVRGIRSQTNAIARDASISASTATAATDPSLSHSTQSGSKNIDIGRSANNGASTAAAAADPSLSHTKNLIHDQTTQLPRLTTNASELAKSLYASTTGPEKAWWGAFEVYAHQTSRLQAWAAHKKRMETHCLGFVEMYEHPLFNQGQKHGGFQVPLLRGNYTTEQLTAAGITGSTIRSMKIPQGCVVDIYDANHFNAFAYSASAQSKFRGQKPRIGSLRIRDLNPQTLATTANSTAGRHRGAVMPPDANNTIPKVCICLGITSRGFANTHGSKQHQIGGKHIMTKYEDTALHKVFIPSVKKTIEANLTYEIHLAVDKGDTFWETHVPAVVKETNKTANLKAFVHSVMPGTFTKVINQLFHAVDGGGNGCDYYVRVNDDTEFISRSWASAGISALRGMKPSNVGVVGPTVEPPPGEFFIIKHDILTFDMVHKTHLKLFDVYYPSELDNWWIDDWITEGTFSLYYYRMLPFDRTLL